MRNPVFDIMKGVGILAMIAGHTDIPGLLVKVIFAWHMPLFFLVSGYFFRPQSLIEAWRKNISALIIPYLLTAVVMLILCMGYVAMGIDRDIIRAFAAIFIGAGSRGVPMLGEYSIGAIWFLLAMFWCKIIYNYVSIRYSSRYKSGGVILSLSVLGTYAGTQTYLPTDVLQGVSAMLFFGIGHQMAKIGIPKRISRWKMICGFLLLTMSLYSSYVDGGKDVPLSMVRCHYTYYPVNVLAALFCIHVIYVFSTYVVRWKYVCQSLEYWGRISLLILCVHIIDLDYGVINYACTRMLGTGVAAKTCMLAGHLGVALCGSWILARIPVVRSVFHIR